MSGLTTSAHRRWVRDRRVQVIANHLADLVEPDASVLDVGCGDGRIGAALLSHRPDLTVQGVEFIVRPESMIDVRPFDGSVLPFPDQSFGCVVFVDVLHHTEAPAILLAEAARVARHQVVIKDHLREGWCAAATLRFMDRVGNAGCKMPMPGNYLSRQQWREHWQDAGLELNEVRTRLGLYPFPLRLLFERSLHFVASLCPVEP